MPALHTYNVFISHAWDYNEDYYKLENLLNEAPNFQYRNYSVPQHDPAEGKDLEEELRNQMRPAQVFLIIAGMYANHSEWIQFEIDYAVRNKKRIVVVRPRGAERMPTKLQNLANSEEVAWNGASIVQAIRNSVS